MVDGLCLDSFNRIPKIYNLMMLLRISAISVGILCLQSSSSMQSLLLILIEIAFLAVIIKYQVLASALESTVIFWARIFESVTLAFYGIVCLFYSFKSESMDSWGKLSSYPAFTIFVATMAFEYLTLIYSILSSLKPLVLPQRNNRTTFAKSVKMNKNGILRKKKREVDIKTNEKIFLDYWRSHSFISVIELQHKSDKGEEKTNGDNKFSEESIAEQGRRQRMRRSDREKNKANNRRKKRNSRPKKRKRKINEHREEEKEQEEGVNPMKKSKGKRRQKREQKRKKRRRKNLGPPDGSSNLKKRDQKRRKRRRREVI